MLAALLAATLACDRADDDAGPGPTSTSVAPTQTPPPAPVALAVSWRPEVPATVVGDVQSVDQRDAVVGAAGETFGEARFAGGGLRVDDSGPVTDDDAVAAVASVVAAAPDLLQEGHVQLRDDRLVVEGTMRLGVEESAIDALLDDVEVEGLAVEPDVHPAPSAPGFEIAYAVTDDGVTVRGVVTDDDRRRQVLTAARRLLGVNEVTDELSVDEVEPTRGTVRFDGVVGERAARLLRGLWPQPPAEVVVDDDLEVTDEATAVEQINEVAKLEPIRFDEASAGLDDSAVETVDRVAALLGTLDDVVVRVEGHTDGFGDPADNLELSRARAVTVRDALVDRGVDPELLTTAGFGSGRPVVDDEAPGGSAANRRIEFRLLTEALGRPGPG